MRNLANKIVLEKGDELKRVLSEARLDGYASGNVNDNGNGTKFTDYRSGSWVVEDTWGGGEPFGGMINAFYNDILCWNMGYEGKIEDNERKAEVEAFLKEALSQPNSAFAVRGPRYYGSSGGKNALRYSCDCSNEEIFDIGKFEIKDEITNLNGEILYSGKCWGGWKNIY